MICGSSPLGSHSRTRTGSRSPRAPVGSLANAAAHSGAVNRDARKSGESTAIVRSACSAACCIARTKFEPGRKSQACSTTVYPASSRTQAIHSAHRRSAPV